MIEFEHIYVPTWSVWITAGLLLGTLLRLGNAISIYLERRSNPYRGVK